MKLAIALDENSIATAIKELDIYANSIEAKCNEVCRRLAEVGVETAVKSVPIDTGWLASDIHLERLGNCDYLVVSDGKYAAFVEFGTGVVGQGSYPYQLPAGYGYDERRTPEAHDPDDPETWFYIDAEGKRRRTRGHVAQPYMAPAAEQVRNQVLKIAKEVFND